MSSCNPWSVQNINDFWFLSCPECSFKTKQQGVFQNHAVENHPKSFELFNEKIDNSFPENIKMENLKVETSSDYERDEVFHEIPLQGWP